MDFIKKNKEVHIMVFMQPEDIEKNLNDIPEEMPILPVRNTVIFPFSLMPLSVAVPRSVKLVEDSLQKDKIIGLVSSKDPALEEPKPGQVYEIGTVAKIHRVQRNLDGSLQVLVEGLDRFKIEHWLETEPYLKATR
jgi:ATP-dependent Lon protease